MYVGRIVGVGKTSTGRNVGLFRVSSRNFPNREIVQRNGSSSLAVVAKRGFESEAVKSRYVTYTAMATVGEVMVVGNGLHTDTIVQEIKSGTPIKQSLAKVLVRRLRAGRF